MLVHNRLEDVLVLINKSLQDFVKLVIKENWQEYVYKKAEYAVKNNIQYSAKYISVYDYMRDYDIKSYSVEHMDATFINELVHGCKCIVPTEKETRIAIERVASDRNIKSHLSSNEEETELYLFGLLALMDLKIFIKTIDKFETSIDNQLRLEYRQNYVKKIDELKSILDDERIELVQFRKQIRKDIDKILNSERPIVTWENVHKQYFDNYFRDQNQKYFDFIISCSDSGIEYAHKLACIYYSKKKMVKEFEIKLYELYNSFDDIKPWDVKGIMNIINGFIFDENELTEVIGNLVNILIENNHSISKNENGLFMWENKVA